ncbi:MAG: PASTA domain-containing protein [Gaiellaceae bacterium]
MSQIKRIPTVAVLLALLFALAGCGKSEQVTVPDVKGMDPVTAYAALHRAGLRVSINTPLRFNGGMQVRSMESAGSRVARGSTVSLEIVGNYGWPGHRLMPAPIDCKHAPETAPNLIGKSLSAVLHLDVNCLAVDFDEVPPLRDAGRPQLFDNYVISRQSPAAGARFLPVSASHPPPQIVTIQVTAAR